LQLAAGGWFRGRNHSSESKKKISGKNNPRYGVVVKGTETAKKLVILIEEKNIIVDQNFYI
jgi:hypothetical protein